MNIYLKFTPEFDFYFQSNLSPEEYIKIDLKADSSFLLNAIQASLMNNRKVVLATEENVFSEIKIDKLNAHHFFKGQNFMFLNISLKNKIDKIKVNSVIYTKFQDIEDHLSKLLQL